jgi:hypothetical protein
LIEVALIEVALIEVALIEVALGILADLSPPMCWRPIGGDRLGDCLVAHR